MSNTVNRKRDKKMKYTNGDCDFYHNCINGEGGCKGCVHNLEEEEWR